MVEMGYYNSQAPEYLVAVIPYGSGMEFTLDCKHILIPHFGDRHALRSLPHFTIFQFSEKELLSHILEGTRDFCQRAVSQNVVLENYKTYGNRVLFLEPERNSKSYLRNLFKGLVEHLGMVCEIKSPHLTIIKDLTIEELQVAQQLLAHKKVDNVNFLCDTILIRKFDRKIGHYTQIVEEFKFGYTQSTLFD